MSICYNPRMALRGIGTDIVEIARFEEQKPAFFERVFTPNEIAYCRAQAQPGAVLHFAARFAAKEAAVKALSWLLLPPPRSHRFEIVRNSDSGAPAIRLVAGRYQAAPPTLPPGLLLHASLSHGKDWALALVVAEETA